ncbi:DapH/DapD/GlmU-related protein [Algoriphagus sp.]|uniref:DapH/DapD/GlmU-related protein n=1 Tax=Algoriphagus sp. TaxID=1872435 RepID=UPI00329967A9
MIIAGAGGHGMEVHYILIQEGINSSDFFFFDENPESVKRKGINSPVLFELAHVQNHFKTNPRFVLGVGNPAQREKLFHLLNSLGGCFHGIRSNYFIDNSNSSPLFDAMPYSFVGPETKIGRGVLINTRAHVHHECEVGEFSEIGPGAMLLGGSKIGKSCRIGAGAVVLPGVELGDEVVVGAGAVVTKSVIEKSTLVGVPAKSIS